MYCIKCGSDLKEGIKFCQSCGNPVEDGGQVDLVNADKFYESDVIMNAIVKKDVEYYREMFRKIANNDMKGTKAKIGRRLMTIGYKLIRDRKMEKEFKKYITYYKIWIVDIILLLLGSLTMIIPIFLLGIVLLCIIAIPVSKQWMNLKKNFNKVYFEKIKSFIVENGVTEENVNTTAIQEKILENF